MSASRISPLRGSWTWGPTAFWIGDGSQFELVFRFGGFQVLPYDTLRLVRQIRVDQRYPDPVARQHLHQGPGHAGGFDVVVHQAQDGPFVLPQRFDSEPERADIHAELPP